MGKRAPDYVREVIIFSIGFGVFLGVGAFFLMLYHDRQATFAGISRGLIVGLPLMLIAMAFVGAGIALWVTRRSWPVYSVITTSWLTGALYVVVMVVFTGKLGLSLITAGFVLGPLLVWHRGLLAVQQLRQNAGDERQGATAPETAS